MRSDLFLSADRKLHQVCLSAPGPEVKTVKKNLLLLLLKMQCHEECQHKKLCENQIIGSALAKVLGVNL